MTCTASLARKTVKVMRPDFWKKIGGDNFWKKEKIERSAYVGVSRAFEKNVDSSETR